MSGVAKRGITLAAIAAICATLVAATYSLTIERIAANEQAFLERSLEPALAGVDYDGSISESKLVMEPPHALPGDDAAIIYRAYYAGAPVAALFAVTARGGYAGPIRILVGVDVAGAIAGLRVLEQRAPTGSTSSTAVPSATRRPPPGSCRSTAESSTSSPAHR